MSRYIFRLFADQFLYTDCSKRPDAGLVFVKVICSVLLESASLLAVGWGADQGIGGFGDEPGIKAQLLNLIRSVRTVMRGK